MTYSYFQNFRAKIVKNELPGREAQLLMTPESRQQELMNLDVDSLSPKLASVLCLLYPNEKNELYFPLILRNKYPGVHSNQVGFPGGGFGKKDKDFLACALRETEEEIGVNANNVLSLRQLSDVYIPPSNFLVKAFVGMLEHTPAFKADPNEVQQIIHVPLKDLLNDAKLTQKRLSTSYASSIEVQAFEFEGFIVWGATAMILSELKVLLKNCEIGR
jgi:8-oxo-dGTP pyrophosphatase MutT (NUDIX family)